jgi:hypothetical protein
MGHLCGDQADLPGFVIEISRKPGQHPLSLSRPEITRFPAPRTGNQPSLGDSRPGKLGILSVGPELGTHRIG